MIRSRKLNPQKVDFKVSKYGIVKVTETNTQIQVQAINGHISGANIIKLDADHYKVRRTGAIKDFKHSDNRADSINTLAQSMKKLRDTINANVTNVENVKWVTLTYKDNVQDEKRLYDDFRKFIMRLRYYCKKNDLPDFEYISVVEYQARGALHAHVLFIWDTPAPFIANDIISKIWGFGFTKTKALKGTISNLGNYLTAYLTDLPLHEAIISKTDLSKHQIKAIDGKRYVKASRLHLYPPNTRLFRTSKGIIKPKTYKMHYNELKQLLDSKNAELSWETLLNLYDDANKLGFSILVDYKYYDITPDAQNRVLLCKSYKISRYYRKLYVEMIDIAQAMAEIQDYYSSIDNFEERYC